MLARPSRNGLDALAPSSIGHHLYLALGVHHEQTSRTRSISSMTLNDVTVACFAVGLDAETTTSMNTACKLLLGPSYRCVYRYSGGALGTQAQGCQ